jgi:hypothetical protein|tara:strand:- start:137 stop:757 length:621 start_codon:yes stop_codon:yes gene_type:complete
MRRCFVIANGESRKNFDINTLWPYGTVIGINAVYRDKPKLDYLVGVDIKMMNEIGDSGYDDSEIWTYPRTQIKHQYFKRFKEDKGWSSGPTAVWLAIQKEFDEVFILGMDFCGVEYEGKTKLRMNNMYKGTPNYREAKREATFSGNWENQMKRNCQSRPNTKFVRICSKDVNEFRFVPKKLKDVENLSMIYYEDLAMLMQHWEKTR